MHVTQAAAATVFSLLFSLERHALILICFLYLDFQALHWQRSSLSRPISGFSRVLAPPSHLRYQTVGQCPLASPLPHPARHTGHQVRTAGLEEDWEETVSLCVLSGPGEHEGQSTLVEVRLLGPRRLGELLASGVGRPGEFLFPLTTVDGRREDDISVSGDGEGGERWRDDDGQTRERESFRSLFETERCPAPFMWGSQFYCFHCPETEPSPGGGSKSSLGIGPGLEAAGPLRWPPTSHCSHPEISGGEGEEKEREREREEKKELVTQGQLRTGEQPYRRKGSWSPSIRGSLGLAHISLVLAFSPEHSLRRAQVMAQGAGHRCP